MANNTKFFGKIGMNFDKTIDVGVKLLISNT